VLCECPQLHCKSLPMALPILSAQQNHHVKTSFIIDHFILYRFPGLKVLVVLVPVFLPISNSLRCGENFVTTFSYSARYLLQENGKHESVANISKITEAASRITLKVFEHLTGPHFRTHPQSTAPFNTRAFTHIPSHQLVLLTLLQPVREVWVRDSQLSVLTSVLSWK
jgi:hypothetical protein